MYSVKNTEFSRIQLELLCCTLLLMELLLSLCRLVYLEMRLPHGASFAEASFLARNTSSLPDLVFDLVEDPRSLCRLVAFALRSSPCLVPFKFFAAVYL